MYIKVKHKFIITALVVVLWTVICSIIEIPWWTSLSQEVGSFLASVIVIGLAFLPGIMISLTLTGIILDKPKRTSINYDELEDITILVAAYNEQDGIYDTLKSLAVQNYSKRIIVNVIDNNSKDNTKQEIFRAKSDFPNIEINYMLETKQGKFAALNHGLQKTTTKYVITIDADTYMYRDSIANIVNAMVQENKNKNIGAIAGTVLVRNSRVNLLTKMQEWEYFLSIAGIKRCQGLFQSVLVSQGAFSIYNTQLVKDIGGWKDSIGEDIVLTWEILSRGYKTYYADRAISFTNVPTELKIFMKQRARWARGMIEGFRHFSFKRCTNKYACVFIFCDLFLFLIDFSVTFFYITGIIIAICFKNYLIVGPMTLLLLPLTLIFFAIMLVVENEKVFKPLGLKIRKHYIGLIIFILTYSILLSPTCIWGYIQEALGTKRKWR